MTDMWFVVDGNVESDTPRTTISPEKNTAEQTGQQSRPKQKGSTMEDNMNAKRSETYEAAINYMKQSSPVCFDRPLIFRLSSFLPLSFRDTYMTGMSLYMYHMTCSTWSFALRSTDCKCLLFLSSLVRLSLLL